MIQSCLRHLTMIFLLLFHTLSLLGQQLGGTTAAPTATIPDGSSQLSSIYSPSLYDGTVNVTIPIFQYGTEGANYGVGLGYNTRGVKVSELSSDAGMHWQIQAGGGIQRTVRGLPDELGMPIDTTYFDSTHYYTRMKGRLNASFETAQQIQDASTYRDGESDEFVVSAGDLSFSFYLGKGRQLFTIPEQHVQVQILSNGTPLEQIMSIPNAVFPPMLSIEFLVTDKEGNQYYFVGGDDLNRSLRLDVDPVQNQLGGYYFITRWVLKKVTLATGGQINYDYETAQTLRYGPYSFSTKEPISIRTSFQGGQSREAGHTSRISHIRYPNATEVYFQYETDPAKYRCDLYLQDGLLGSLREIKVAGPTGNCLRYQLVQDYQFAFSFFNQTLTSRPYGCDCYDHSIPTNPNGQNQESPLWSHRLRLNGINLLSCDGSVSEPFYTFTYDNTNLPISISGSQDYFGYYNGKTPVMPGNNTADKQLAVPYHTMMGTPSLTFGVDKTSDLNYMKAGILTGVTNAYGGKVSFEYDANNCDASLLGTLISLPTSAYFMGRTAADGLRIATIMENEPWHPENTRITNFSYSGGQLFLTGGFLHYPYHNEEYQAGVAAGGYMTNSYVTAHHYIGGANHGYSEVAVYTRNQANEMLGRKVTTFSNFSDATSGNQPRYRASGKHFFEFPYTDKQYLRDWEMGQVLKEEEYDNNARIVQRTTNTYSPTVVESADGTAFANTKTSYVAKGIFAYPTGGGYLNAPIPAQWPVTDTYIPYRGKSPLTQTLIERYQTDASFISDNLTYTYDNHNNLKTTTVRDSKGDELQTINYYNYDAAADDPQPGLEKVVSTQRWKRLTGGPMPDNGALLDAYFTGYAVSGSAGNYNLIRNKTMYNLKAGAPLNYNAYLGSGPANNTPLKIKAAAQSTALPGFAKTSDVLLSDQKGNPLETYLPEGDQYKAMIWDDLTGDKIAEVVGARYNDIAYTSFETSFYNTNFLWSVLLGRVSPGGVTGKKAYSLWDNSTNFSYSLDGTKDLQSGVEYTLSLWIKGPLPAITYDVGGSIPLPTTASVVKGDWSKYSVRFTPSANTKIKIKGSGGGSYIDEVRLCPTSAMMKSWTYEPLLGKSSETGPSSRFSTYEYDKFGRPTLVRDQEGHIMNKTQTVTKGAE